MCSLSSYKYDQNYLIGVNYDFYFPYGLLIIASAGVEKKSLGQPQCEWFAKYSTVTLNQFGRELPTAGMNEVGLAGHVLQQDNNPAYLPEKPSLNELQWLQFILDTCASIDDIAIMAERFSMKWEIYPVHYGFADARGNLAFVAFSAEGIQIHRPDETHPPVLTNTEYQLACQTWVDDKRTPKSKRDTSQYRFAQLAAAKPLVYSASKADVKEELLQRLQTVAAKKRWWDKWLFWLGQKSLTVWTSLFDPQARSLEFFTLGNPEKKTLVLNPTLFEQAKAHGGLVVHLTKPVSGDLGQYLKPYRRQDNAHIINIAYPKNLLNAEQRKALIEYPETYNPII